jgi:hypothetical protein
MTGTTKNGTETKVNIDNSHNCEGMKENAAYSSFTQDFTGLIGFGG